MNKQAEHYEQTGDNLQGDRATRAYHAAQNHLQPTDSDYITDLKRLQGKILKSLDNSRETNKFTTQLYSDQVIWLKQTAAAQKTTAAELLRQWIDEKKNRE